jgi:membrane protein DedA with SNARE-associated domain
VIEPVLMTAAALASSSPPLPGFLNTLASPLLHYGLWAIGLLVLVEDFGIPVPGETILIAGAIYAGAGQLNIVAVGVVAFIAAVLGDNIGFAIGHFGGRALALRWGKYVFLTEDRLNRAEKFFGQHGGKIITVARFIEGLRQANGIIAGISGMHWRRFLAFNALGAALWVGTWVSIGYLAGNHITTIYHYITQYSYYVLIVIAVLLVAYLARRLRRRRRPTSAVTSTTSEKHETGSITEAAEVTPAPATEAAERKPAPAPAEPTPGTHAVAELKPDGHAVAELKPDGRAVAELKPDDPEAPELAPSEPAADLNGAPVASERSQPSSRANTDRS